MSLALIAWNRIFFAMPSPWEIHSLGRRHLVLAQGESIVAELKWNRIKGHFRPSGYMNRLVKRMKRQTGVTIVPFTLPDKWIPMLDSYGVYGFRWQTAQIGGLGALLFCPACRTATLIQFYANRDRRPSDSHVLGLLKSFRDHRDDGETIWSLYDIHARLPEQMELARFRFNPGDFELAFSVDSRLISLHRWSPAAVLLEGMGLDGFARQRFPIEASRVASVANPDPKIYEWKRQIAGSSWNKFVERFQFRPPLNQLRLWHLGQANRILGVAVVGRKPMEPGILDRICNSYEVV
jgi:hypothetical protein